MRVHHLDCFTMCPIAGRHLNAEGRLVGHVLAVELPEGSLALVDTGLGLGAVQDMRGWVGRIVADVFRPQRDPAAPAVRRLEALGFQASDVSDVFLTHLDADHAGGIADFPAATVHVHADELRAAQHPGPDLNARIRRHPHLLAHGPRWATFTADGEEWFGFPATRELREGIVAVPLPGHTRGHSAIAVRGNHGWLLHAGDSYYHGGAVRPHLGTPTRYARLLEAVNASSPRKVRANLERLRELAKLDEVDVFCAHDPAELARARSGSDRDVALEPLERPDG